MAKLINPLMSQTASGGLARRITYAYSRTGAYAKSWHAPNATTSQTQFDRRQSYKMACAAWQTMSEQAKMDFAPAAAAAKISLFNAFIANYLRTNPAGNRFTDPSFVAPAVHWGTRPEQTWSVSNGVLDITTSSTSNEIIQQYVPTIIGRRYQVTITVHPYAYFAMFKNFSTALLPYSTYIGTRTATFTATTTSTLISTRTNTGNKRTLISNPTITLLK